MIVLAKQWLLCKKLFSVTHAKGKRRISSARLLRALFCFETRAPAKPLEMGEGQAFILESLKKGGQNARRKFALWFSPSVFATLSAGV